jgi:hypothetical protein
VCASIETHFDVYTGAEHCKYRARLPEDDVLLRSRKFARLCLCVAPAALGCGTATPTPEPGPGQAGAPAAAAPSASWVETAVARIRVDKGDAGGMRGCTGSLTPEAKTFFTAVYAEARKCASSAKGSVTFHSTLEEGGGLSEFSVLEDKLGAPAVIACIQGKAVSVEFPRVLAATPCVQLVHPMTFP